ncbi:MAG: ATP-binding cassette domain-containing protein [Spirochaetaceae bacterium]|jgi:zinc transport system ATP-binding protein|nr:ATP-binding cassette domain-containing protein [Spirochaetaceae bacterium]
MLITCQNVSFGYDGHCVISGLSFSVHRGDYLCIIGGNGSGKTTLIKGLLQLLRPMQGSITFSGETGKNAIGYLSQQSAAKRDFPAGVSEIVLSGMVGGMGLRPFYSRREKAVAEENMKRLEIADLANRCFRELSGGQQRRVLIARALCAASRSFDEASGAAPRALLVLDEPASGLDPAVRSELYELLTTLNKTSETTIIMVTHDMDAASSYANRVLSLENGSYFFGDASEYKARSESSLTAG